MTKQEVSLAHSRPFLLLTMNICSLAGGANWFQAFVGSVLKFQNISRRHFQMLSRTLIEFFNNGFQLNGVCAYFANGKGVRMLANARRLLFD